jgi:ubiquinone biosynthesis protein
MDLVRDIGFKGISRTVQVPKDYVLLNRTVTLLLGISNTLDPAYNPLETVRPYAQQYLLQDKGGPLGYVRELLQRMVTNALALPDDLQKTMRKARSGDMEIRTPDVASGSRHIAHAIRQLTFAVLGIGAAFFGMRLSEAGLSEESTWIFWGAALLTIGALWPLRTK